MIRLSELPDFDPVGLMVHAPKQYLNPAEYSEDQYRWGGLVSKVNKDSLKDISISGRGCWSREQIYLDLVDDSTRDRLTRYLGKLIGFPFSFNAPNFSTCRSGTKYLFWLSCQQEYGSMVWHPEDIDHPPIHKPRLANDAYTGLIAVIKYELAKRGMT